MVWLSNVLRYFNLLLAGVSTALTCLVVREAGRARRKPGGPPQLLYWHICAISVGTQGLVITGATWAMTHLDRGLAWPLFGFLPSTLLVAVSLILILQVQRARAMVQEGIIAQDEAWEAKQAIRLQSDRDDLRSTERKAARNVGRRERADERKEVAEREPENPHGA